MLHHRALALLGEYPLRDSDAEWVRLTDAPLEVVIGPFEVYEDVFPLSFPVIPLLRALVSGDAERAIELGALELDEEDVALLSAVCPARYDYASALREFLAGEARGAGHE